MTEHFIFTPVYSYTNNSIFLIENGYAFGCICLYERKLGKVIDQIVFSSMHWWSIWQNFVRYLNHYFIKSLETFAGIEVSDCSYGLGSTLAIKDEIASKDTFKITFFLICRSWKLWRGNVAQTHSPCNPICATSSHTDNSFSPPSLNLCQTQVQMHKSWPFTHTDFSHNSISLNQHPKSGLTKYSTHEPISPLKSFIV